MLERDDLERIVHLETDKLISRLKTKNITLALSQEALSLIIKNGYDPQYGARRCAAPSNACWKTRWRNPC